MEIKISTKSNTYKQNDKTETQKKKSKRTSFSKILAILILLGDLGLSFSTLYLCYIAIINNFEGGLPYLVTLIGLFNVATGYVLGQYLNKSKAENTKGGIVYDTVMMDSINKVDI